MRANVFKPPTTYNRIWEDSGSGAEWEVSFWEPICPANYYPLGHVSVRRHSPMPSLSEIRCVKEEYTIQGEWVKIWSGVSNNAAPVTIYQANPTNNYGQGVSAMSAVAGLGPMQTPRVLNPKHVHYFVRGKPAKKYTLQNIEYLIDQRQVLSLEPQVLNSVSALNSGKSEQELKLTVS